LVFLAAENPGLPAKLSPPELTNLHPGAFTTLIIPIEKNVKRVRWSFKRILLAPTSKGNQLG
jgi:hypothetical protein